MLLWNILLKNLKKTLPWSNSSQQILRSSAFWLKKKSKINFPSNIMCLKSPVTIKPQWEMNVHILFKNSSLTDFIVEFKSFYFAWSLSHLCIYLCVFVCMWWWWFRFFFSEPLLFCVFFILFIFLMTGSSCCLDLDSGFGLSWTEPAVWFGFQLCFAVTSHVVSFDFCIAVA